MPLQRGTRLGPYEILGPLGAGGMSEVYRARDPRLARDVAVKVLSSTTSQDPERLRRFQQEAKAAGVLNHPNVLALYDVGVHEGLPYVVSELLEGETLREKLQAGPLPARRAVDWAVQIAQGLAAAHDRGIVHRDLKPENVFVTRDGRLKILDFGLAKLTEPLPPARADSDQAPTAAIVTPSSHSHPGLVVGTAGYMSPEQVRGGALDHRSDVFSFGAILYEMLTGRRAFRGGSAVETMSAILKEEPPDLESVGPPLPAGLARLVRHCLEKNPEERFQSARDLAFGLQAVSALSGLSGALPALLSAPRRTITLGQALAGAAALAVLAASLFVAGRRSATVATPAFRQLTFKRGAILRARFVPDGQTVVYGAAWDGRPFQVFVSRLGSPESSPLEPVGADILALSRGGEMALALGQRFRGGFQFSGTLARAPLAGGAPRELLEDVFDADWGPDGSLAVVRTVGGRDRLEYPAGQVRFEAGGWISHPRVSPRGYAVAFVHHPAWPDDGGDVMLLDLAGGGARALASGYASVQGLAWSPRGEVWFTAAERGRARALHAVAARGRPRVVARAPGRLTLQDVAADGRVLLSRDVVRYEIAGRSPEASAERDLSWLDGSQAQDLSDDGRTVLFSEAGEGSGGGYGVYVRATDGTPAVRLGDGLPTALSPDGKWALTLQRTSPPEIVLLPVGVGEPRRIPRHQLADYLWAHWRPDGGGLVINGAEPGRGYRSYLQDLEGGPPRPVTPEGLWTQWVSPDGRSLALSGTGTPISIQPLDGGEPRSVAGAQPGDRIAHWGSDGALYVFRREDVPCRVYRIDPRDGRRELFRTLSPADPAGVVATNEVQLAAELHAYTYTYLRILSELYLVEGLL
jgi:Tol biopolymer transport system component